MIKLTLTHDDETSPRVSLTASDEELGAFSTLLQLYVEQTRLAEAAFDRGEDTDRLEGVRHYIWNTAGDVFTSNLFDATLAGHDGAQMVLNNPEYHSDWQVEHAQQEVAAITLAADRLPELYDTLLTRCRRFV